MNDICDRCGEMGEGVEFFAAAYRKKELKSGRPDPGNLCRECAGSDTGRRIAEEMMKREGDGIASVP